MSKAPRLWAKQHTIKKNSYEFNGLLWPIQGTHGGINKRHLERIFYQLDVMLNRYSKVLVVRFDLHMPAYTDDNELLTLFRRRFFKRIRAKYSIKDIAYFWCREYEKGKGQHYHWAIIVDGKKAKSGYPTNELATLVWTGLGGSIHKGQYHHFSRREHEKQKNAIEHLSYLAKVRTKGYAGDKIKCFSSSKLDYPDGYINWEKGLYSKQKSDSKENDINS